MLLLFNHDLKKAVLDLHHVDTVYSTEGSCILRDNAHMPMALFGNKNEKNPVITH